MAVIAPQTDLYLLKTPLSMDDNTLSFTDASAQAKYFLSLTKIGVDDFTYQRKDHTIRFPAQYDHVVNYNYVMYRNTAYSNKWFYAFITGMRYINDSLTEITIKTDVFQTWLFDISFDRTNYIERATRLNDDQSGAYAYKFLTIPESIETGDYTTYSSSFYDLGGASVVMAVSDFPTASLDGGKEEYLYNSDGDLKGDVHGRFIGGTYSGLMYFIFKAKDYESISKIITIYNYTGKADAVVSIYMIPDVLANALPTSFKTYSCNYAFSGTATMALINANTYEPIKLGEIEVAEPDGSYATDAEKIKTFPYQYIEVNNNAGSSAIFHYEDFNAGAKPKFIIYGTLAEGGSIICVPDGYKRQDARANWEYGISAPKSPTCGWVSDTYVNWLTQNSVNLTTGLKITERTASTTMRNTYADVQGSMMNALLGAIGNLSSGNLTSIAPSLVSSYINSAVDLTKAENSTATDIVNKIADINAQKQSHELVPDQAHGNASLGNVTWAEKLGFTFKRCGVKDFNALSIQSYFKMYGYARNRLKTISEAYKKSKYFDYIKTVGCNLSGNLPQDDIAEFQQRFDNGIRVWYDPAQIYNYTANNEAS